MDRTTSHHTMESQTVTASSNDTEADSATVHLDSPTLTEVVFLSMDSVIGVDTKDGVPFLVLTDGSGSNDVQAKLVMNGCLSDMAEPASPACGGRSDKLEDSAVLKTKLDEAVILRDVSIICPKRECQFVKLERVLRQSEVDVGPPVCKQKALRCEFEGCTRTFYWPAHLKYHMLTHSGNRPFKCPFPKCDKNFYTQQRLDVHIRSHTGEKPFICAFDGCDRRFTTAGNLRNHSRIHTGERPFMCETKGCGRSFTELSSLKKHSLVHTGDKPFSCDVCGMLFSQIGSRNAHRRRSHRSGIAGEGSPQPEAAKSECDVIVIQQEVEFVSDCDYSASSPETIVVPLPVVGERLGDSKVLRVDDNVAGDVLAPSNANVLVVAQPSSGFHLMSPRIPREEVHYKSILIQEDDGRE